MCPVAPITTTRCTRGAYGRTPSALLGAGGLCSRRATVTCVDRDGVMRWVAEYERAWRSGDIVAVTRLFTEDARYRPSPYEEPEVGHAGIQAFWRDDEGTPFTVRAEPVAVEGSAAVVRR